MPETDPCILGRWSCGCITYANAEPDNLDRESRKEIADIVARGGEIIRTTVSEARMMPHFLAGECPHNPKGWEREVPKEPNRLRYTRVRSRNLSVVYVVVPRWPTGFRGGEVAKRDGKWWATEGWMDTATATATNGSEQRAPSPVFGPFGSQREAAEHLIPLAEKRSAAFAAEMDAARDKRKAAA